MVSVEQCVRSTFRISYPNTSLIAIKELNRAGKVIRDSKVLILGLTYKENVPDTWESPAGEMVHELKEFDIDVYGYDPLLGSGGDRAVWGEAGCFTPRA